MLDLRDLPDVVDAEPDAVADPTGFDDGLAFAAVERERHGDQRLQGVALGAARRTGISFVAGGPHIEVDHGLHGLRRYARAVVSDRD